MNWEPTVGTTVCHQETNRIGVVRQRLASDRYRVLWVTGSDRGEMETLDLADIAPLAECDFLTLSTAVTPSPAAPENPALERVRVQIKHSRNIARVTMLPEIRELVDAMCNDIEKAIEG